MLKNTKLKKLFGIMSFIVIASLMTACSKNYVKPQLPSNLKHCEPIPEFKGESFGDVAESYFELIFLYKDCNAKSEAKNSYFE